MKNTLVVLFFFVLLFSAADSMATVEVTVFGPVQYTRTTGAPNVFQSSFPAVAGKGTLVVTNGDPTGMHRISSASIRINDTEVVGRNSFNQRVSQLTLPVDLNPQNIIYIELDSVPGSFLSIRVVQMAEAEWLTFLEGNPEVPGDGILIDSTAGIGGPVFELAVPVRLSSLEGGFTFSAFPQKETPPLRLVQLGVTNYVYNSPCSIWFSAQHSSAGQIPVTSIVLNAVPGFSTSVSSAFLQSMLQWINEEPYRIGCPKVTLEDLYLDHILLETIFADFTTVLDAAAIGLGENNFPGTTIP
jgi:hypothetical protein